MESVVIDIDDESIKTFQDKIMTWWSINARDLPWRRDPSPYNVLVSEIMLQQTQVSRVAPKYLEFLQAFPTLKDLAKTDTKRLLQVWSGLGYNRRAVWLKEAAQSIVDMESFPTTVDELRKLKGIGTYTSRSILIFAFNQNLAAVDTNIRRIFIASGFTTEDASEKDLQNIANLFLLRESSRDWHNALMDYGSKVLSSSSTGISPKSQQPKFDGSIRQVRGQVIRILTDSVSLSKEDLCSRLDSESMKHIDIDKVLNKLVEDRLIEFSTTGDIRISE